MEMTQRQLTLKGEKPSLAVTILSGGLAGFAFWASALPMDTVKTWIQSSDIEKEALSVRAELNRIFQQSGTIGAMKRLFRGWQVAYSRGIPSAAITVSSYCLVYEQLQQMK
jgi:solute carrier family 25 carnitine/acylcarnitine transporter 20/29